MAILGAAFAVVSFVPACSRAPETSGEAPATPQAQQPRTKPESQAERDARDKAVEGRLTPYFQSQVGPRLRDCWNRVQGTGGIALRLTYTKSERDWKWQALTVTGSTLSADQQAVASDCVRGAVRETGFPVDPTDTQFQSSKPAAVFAVNWSFPVPLPPDAAVAMAQARNDDDEGDDDEPASCWICGPDPSGGVCAASKSGWLGCIEHDLGGCVCFGDTCASGGFLGAGGGVIMMRETKPSPQQSEGANATPPAEAR
jgi:hypothetical protein